MRDLSQVIKELKYCKSKGEKIVHCHGVFDLLHVGHIRHLAEAKKFADKLVVSITSDRYVNKGPNRPAFTQDLRAEALSSLECVDYVVINDHPTAIEAIEKIKPNYYIKGIEYKDSGKDVTGGIKKERQAVESCGGELVFTDDITFSSSHLINTHLPLFPDHVKDYLFSFKKENSTEDVLKYLKFDPQIKVLVIGEAIIDKYSYCEAIGKAGKEPVLVTKFSHEETYAGGALAVCNHLSDFCGTIDCLTYLGEKNSYKEFIDKALAVNVNLDVQYKKNSPTIVKKRFISGSNNQKLFEIYEINDTPFSSDEQKRFAKTLKSKIKGYDLVIAVDYGHGLLNEESIQIIADQANFLCVNTQANAGNHGFNCITKYPKANFVSVANRELQLTFRERYKDAEFHLRKLVEANRYDNILVTDGKEGSLCSLSDGPISKTPAFATHVRDKIGAGDAVLALSSFCLYKGASAEILGFIGNIVGAQAVNIMGNKSFIRRVPLVKHISHLLK